MNGQMHHLYVGSPHFHKERGEIEVCGGADEVPYVLMRAWEADHDNLSNGEAILMMRPSEARRVAALLERAAAKARKEWDEWEPDDA